VKNIDITWQYVGSFVPIIFQQKVPEASSGEFHSCPSVVNIDEAKKSCESAILKYIYTLYVTCINEDKTYMQKLSKWSVIYSPFFCELCHLIKKQLVKQENLEHVSLCVSFYRLHIPEHFVPSHKSGIIYTFLEF
jgi:hypothetical protein